MPKKKDVRPDSIEFKENLLGQLLINNKFVSPEQLASALMKQKSEKKHKLLGDILVEDGVLTKRALDVIIHVQEIKRDRITERRKLEKQETKKLPTPKVEIQGGERPPSMGAKVLKNMDKKLDSLDTQVKGMAKSVTESQEELKKLVRQIMRMMPKKR